MSTNISLEIGKRIRKQRESYQYTREKFAEIVGISPFFLAGIECGTKGMSFSTLEKICSALHLSSDFILFGKEEKNFVEITEILSNIDSCYESIITNVVKAFVKGLDEAKNLNKEQR